jgi:hypothetical protein
MSDETVTLYRAHVDYLMRRIAHLRAGLEEIAREGMEWQNGDTRWTHDGLVVIAREALGLPENGDDFHFSHSGQRL